MTIPGQEDPILITTPETPERRVAEDTTTNSISDTAEDVGMDPLEPEKVQYASPFVIVGEVARIEGPFWNQANGQRWSGDSAIYREVSLNVDRVIADPLDVIGGSVEILVHGGGTEDESEPWLGGYLVEGEDVVMFFGVRSWEQRESRLLAFVPSWGSLGIYHLRRDSGVVHVVPDTEVHDAGRFLSFDPRGFPTLEKFLRDVRDLRSEERPEFGTAVPTRKHVLDELAFYQEWTETGEPPIADPPPRTEP